MIPVVMVMKINYLGGWVRGGGQYSDENCCDVAMKIAVMMLMKMTKTIMTTMMMDGEDDDGDADGDEDGGGGNSGHRDGDDDDRSGDGAADDGVAFCCKNAIYDWLRERQAGAGIRCRRWAECTSQVVRGFDLAALGSHHRLADSPHPGV